jgi:hypothetical protein
LSQGSALLGYVLGVHPSGEILETARGGLRVK